MDLFIGIGIAWVVGMAGYIWLSKKKNYNTMQYLSVADKHRKYKKMQENFNEKKTF
jgi:exosome complex RNA-binding protein Rrp4